MSKNLQHSKARTKPSTSLRIKIRTFNFQEQKQKPSISLRARIRTFNLQELKKKPISISA
jgi:hypothetical protein